MNDTKSLTIEKVERENFVIAFKILTFLSWCVKKEIIKDNLVNG